MLVLVAYLLLAFQYFAGHSVCRWTTAHFEMGKPSRHADAF
jgi:hypothetical protein